jgi:hypothetical protein
MIPTPIKFFRLSTAASQFTLTVSALGGFQEALGTGAQLQGFEGRA